MFLQGQDIRPEPAQRHSISTEELIQLRFFPPARYPGHKQLAIRAGQHRSAVRGRGMEYDDVRLYQPGDDIRHLDWRLMARTGEAHTRLFREEKERPVIVVADLRYPMHFATRGHFKSVLSAYASSLVLWSALNHGDRAGGLLLNHAQTWIKPTNSAKKIAQMMHEMANSQVQLNESESPSVLSLESALDQVDQLAASGSRVYLFSDFHDFSETLHQRLLHLAIRCELKLVLLTDPLESQLPEQGRFQFWGNGRTVTIQGSRAQQKSYQGSFQQRLDGLLRINGVSGIEVAQWHTDDHPLFVMKQAKTAGGTQNES